MTMKKRTKVQTLYFFFHCKPAYPADNIFQLYLTIGHGVRLTAMTSDNSSYNLYNLHRISVVTTTIYIYQ